MSKINLSGNAQVASVPAGNLRAPAARSPPALHTSDVTTEAPQAPDTPDYRRGRKDEFDRVTVSLRQIVAGHLYAAAGRVLAGGSHAGCASIVAGYASDIEDGRHPVLPIGTFQTP